jgi:sec-independent protein translocase protein TatB
MIDLGISKLALIGAVALVVIGPEKLPRVARTVGALLGKAQRYVNDVKAEVNRSMELEELKKMKESVESAARNVESSIHETTSDFEKSWSEATAGLEGDASKPFDPADAFNIGASVYPEYKHPRKNFRLKQKAVPQWFKARSGVRTRALSGAARVARYRPKSKSL